MDKNTLIKRMHDSLREKQMLEEKVLLGEYQGQQLVQAQARIQNLKALLASDQATFTRL